MAAEKSQTPQTELTAKERCLLGVRKHRPCSGHSGKKTLCKGGVGVGGPQKALKPSLFLRGGGFKASEELSSPNLGLVILKKARLVV